MKTRRFGEPAENHPMANAYGTRTKDGSYMYAYNRTEHVTSSYRNEIATPWLQGVLSKHGSPLRVLDIASGGGEFANHYHGKSDIQVTSAEINPRGLRRTELGHCVQTDAFYHLPFPRDTFAAIHCKDAYPHVDARSDFFLELARVLSLGGQLLLVAALYTEMYADVLDNGGAIPYYIHSDIETEIAAAMANFRLLTKGRWQQSEAAPDWYIPQEDGEPVERRVYVFQKISASRSWFRGWFQPASGLASG